MLKPGDRVQWNYLGKRGDTGVVVAYASHVHLGGGVKAKVKVRWDSNGFVGSVDDRLLKKLGEEQMKTKFKAAEALIDRYLEQTEPADPQSQAKKDPMTDMPGTPDDTGADKAPPTNPEGDPEHDEFGKGFGKM